MEVNTTYRWYGINRVCPIIDISNVQHLFGKEIDPKYYSNINVMQQDPRTIIIGDIHGAFLALLQVLERSNYNPELDTLICVGDYIDGHKDSYLVCEYLMNLRLSNRAANCKDVILLEGNHDDMFHEVMKYHFKALPEKDTIRNKYRNWWEQGGEATYKSFMEHPMEHIWHLKEGFFNKLKLYYLDEKRNILYVHAGFDYKFDFNYTVGFNTKDLYWTRELYKRALHLQALIDSGHYSVKSETLKLGGFDRIYIGHSQTVDNQYEDSRDYPKMTANVMNVDQGCGYKGRLTAYIHEEERYVQSDLIETLYPDTKYSFEVKNNQYKKFRENIK